MDRDSSGRFLKIEESNTNGANALNNEEQNTVKEKANLASLSFRRDRGQSKRLINFIASLNSAEVEETEESYIISSPFIKVSREEVESISGKISDAQWRLLFVNRTGETREFSNKRIVIGLPKKDDQQEELRDTIQLNIRIDRVVKDNLEKYRSKDFLGISQHEFVENALIEFIENIKKQIL